jgi:hypothetical protein
VSTVFQHSREDELAVATAVLPAEVAAKDLAPRVVHLPGHPLRDAARS